MHNTVHTTFKFKEKQIGLYFQSKSIEELMYNISKSIPLAAIAFVSTLPQLNAQEEYRGRFTPDAEYVLSGQLAEDIGPLPDVPYHYLTDEEGFDSKRLTPIPPPGVHPRVLMSPQDIERIKKQVAKGDEADRYFRIIWNDVQALAQKGDMLSMGLQALVTDDKELGRKAAEKLVAGAKFIEPMVDLMNTHPTMEPIRDNWYYYSRTSVKKVGGEFYRDVYERGGSELIKELAKDSVEFASDGDRQSSGHLFNSDLSNYDYLYDYMTEEERTLVRRVISKLVNDRYTAGMELPGNMFINNHMSMGEDFILLSLAIEGEEGAPDDRLLEQYAISVRNKLTYDISLGGMLHEKCKGFLPERATIAMGRRLNKDLLRHNHLQLMVWGKVMDINNVYQRYAGSKEVAPIGDGLNEDRFWWMGRGSGPWMDQFFNWAFVMKHYYPADPIVDLFYKSSMRAQGLGAAGTDPKEKLPTPRIRYTHRDVMLMTATDGLRNPDGTVVDYDLQGLPKELTEHSPVWTDLARGVGMSRSSWDKDALSIHYEARSDVYSAGHETPEAGDFNLLADGIEWSARSLWYMDSYFRNTVLVDGYAGIYSPVAAELMAVTDTDQGTTFISDNTDQYNWRKHEKMFYLWHPLLEEAGFHMGAFGRHGMNMNRKWELPFQDHMKEYQDGYAGLDWGNWHGETRGPEMYEVWNNIDHAFRTLHLAKGEKPYALVIDDIRKDEQERQYDWCFTLSPDVVMMSADSSVRGRYLQKGMPDNRTTDIILGLADTKVERVNRYGLKSEYKPKKGDPMLLVRTLWRNSTFAYPQPSFEKSYGPARVIIPAKAVDPEFRVLLFPFRHGDMLPVTSWNDDRTQLTVSVGDNTDVYTFGETDRERTVFTVERNGQRAGSIAYGPPTPKLATTLGWTPDRNLNDEVREIVFNKEITVALEQPQLGSAINYTLDGSEPTMSSPLYNGPVTVNKTSTFKARTFARFWPHQKDNGSNTLKIELLDQSLEQPVKTDAAKLAAGLACDVFEIRRTIFDEKTGIFTGKKNMMPVLADYKPLDSFRTDNFDIPKVDPVTEATEMMKAYYNFSGIITVPTDGIYNFRVNACGPIVFTIGDQSVMSVTGPYGLSQKDRYGQVALKAGSHPVKLTVTDPVFWKGEREENYVIDVAMMSPGSDQYLPISNSSLKSPKNGLKPQPKKAVPIGKAVAISNTKTGLIKQSYDRSNRYRMMPPNGYPLDHFDVSGEKPYSSQATLVIDSNNTAGRIDEYTGYFFADTYGIYKFQLDRNGGNQLIIDGHEIVRNSVAAPSLPAAIELDRGWHHFTLRLTGSKPTLRIKVPGSDTYQNANIGSFARPVDTKTSDDGRVVAQINPKLKNGENLEVIGDGVSAILRSSEIIKTENGPAIKLNGGESKIIVEGIPSPNDAFTLAFWMKVNNPKDVAIIDSSWGSHPESRLRHYSMQSRYFRGSDNAEFDLRKVGADKGKWVHVAIVYSNKVELYINGELRSWAPKTEMARTAHVEDLELFVGLDATLQDITIYNKSLNRNEVGAVFSKRKQTNLVN
ncbi:chitobiase/beta-hexosaminidase C-terminal domain-containing protein [Rubellicoccus peritrichatus]|uniref:LamG-like jellyroll fold domain-containing protein n=1 Tax=Rubellicoccus peritrichatus TaxID=3080537 RepID=A0AAQ3QQ29_9BACT|nr:LamG-like jellyroll fold domain-containing protein [Puniceicoccus sp. CR14]WOO39773.1 LamG-like jellyroll fold domain-containing protein [Puniceicoccus sp. CR14]